MDILDFARAKQSTVAYSAIQATYTVAIANAVGDQIHIKNATDKDLVLGVRARDGELVEITLPTEDFSVRAYLAVHVGDIEIKHAGSAPTRGSVFLQSICAGN